MDATAIPSTQTFDALNRAIEVNKQNVEEFKKMIVDQLNSIIEHLQECDPTNASDALDLTIPQLESVVAKLDDKSGLSYTDVENIMAPLKAIQLRKAPDSATPATPLSIGTTNNPLSPPQPPAPLTVGRRPSPVADPPPAAPGITWQQRKENWGNRLTNAANGLKNTSPLVPLPPGTNGLTNGPTLSGNPTPVNRSPPSQLPPLTPRQKPTGPGGRRTRRKTRR